MSDSNKTSIFTEGLFSCNFENLYKFATENQQKQTPEEKKDVKVRHMKIFKPLYEAIGITNYKDVFNVSMQ